MRILALDVGEKRIGVALSGALNLIAQGLETIKRTSDKETLAKIKELIKQYDVGKIIVGMPLNMDGSKGPSALSMEDFISLMKKDIEVSVETVDERLTTAQGERMLLEADVSRKKRKHSIDKIAAQLILQTYLDLHVQKDRSQ
ncbi:MAG: Holliday junction resolvase RuvX [Candidatus Omnitrophica bacterium]|nr:Holliday junction resolvase RuvX [Candidatus Omnitrophota bacterium]